jgi:uracil-DNA glycosylase family 4
MAKKFFTAKPEKPVLSPCEQCKLHSVCISPKLRPVGNGKLKIAIVIDKPTSSMDKYETLASGPEYAFLKNSLDKIGIDLEEDCWLIPVVSCRTPRDRMPKPKEVKSCKDRFNRYIEQYNPNVIITMGSRAFDAIIGHRVKGRLTDTGYDKFYGWVIPDQEMKKYILATYTVEDMLETIKYPDGGISKPLYMRDKAHYNLWIDHLYKACSYWDKTVEIVDYNSMCQITESIDQAIDWISEAMDWEYVAFDIETNSIKCYREGSRILSVSISNGKVSYAFPFFNDFTFKRVFKRLMLNHSKKISHNTSFEYQWIRQKEGYYFNNADIDTMLMAHCINSHNPTGLKYEVYHRLGIIGYDDSADKYIDGTKEEKELYGDNAFNNLEKCPIQDLLLYNALDSLFTYMIYDQMKLELDEFQMEGYKFLNESSLYLTQAQVHGFRVDITRYDEVRMLLEGKIKDIEAELLQCEEISLWDKETPFNYNSGAQLGYLLYTKMGIKPTLYTDGGAPATSVEAIEKIDTPLVKKILEIRKYQKLFGTYIHQFALEQTEGRIHAFTYLNRVETFRSSMGSINIQNQPKRDKFAKSLITSMVLPEKGQRLVGYDLKGAEVTVSACNSLDDKLIEYVENLKLDMHRDLCMHFFSFEKEQVTSVLRKGMKNTLTFPLFYNSYYVNIAPDLYEFAQENNLMEHLASIGVKTYEDFVARVRRTEEYLWGKMFPKHRAWMKQQWEIYQRDGKLSVPTGFYVYAPMRKNNTPNTPIQGSAYHCNQRTFNRLSIFIQEKNLKSTLLFQIHDAIYISVEPGEEDLLDWAVWYYGTQEIREEWKWLIATLYYEKEMGEIDANWSTLKEVGLLGEGGKIIQK